MGGEWLVACTCVSINRFWGKKETLFEKWSQKSKKDDHKKKIPKQVFKNVWEDFSFTGKYTKSENVSVIV